ncbi:hypothetical protein PSAC2689_220102 [Paraburkholderia sacchari]
MPALAPNFRTSPISNFTIPHEYRLNRQVVSPFSSPAHSVGPVVSTNIRGGVQRFTLTDLTGNARANTL